MSQEIQESFAVQNVPVAEIYDSINYVRTTADPAARAQLRESIEERGGLIYPVRLRRVKGGYEVVDGFGRTDAYRELGWTYIPAIIESEGTSDADALATALIANCQRADVCDMDRALGFRALMELSGLNVTGLAKKIRFSAATVSRLLQLTQLPPEIQSMVRSGKVSGSAAYELGKIDAGSQLEMAQKLAAGEINRDGLVGIIKQRRAGRKPDNTDQPVRVRAELPNDRSIIFSGSGLTGLDVLISWLEELLAKARRARSKGLALATFLRILKDTKS